MAILKSKKTRYEFSIDEIKKLISQDMKIPEHAITMDYIISDTSDDRFNRTPNYELTRIVVVVDETKLNQLTEK